MNAYGSITTRKSIAACMLLMASCMAFGQTNDGSAITAAELQQNGFTYPTDLVAGANHTQFANYAWRLFIASMQETTATLQSGAGRGVPSGTSNFLTTGEKNTFPSPLVFASLYHRTEAFPYYADTQPAAPIDQVPTYYTYYLDSTGQNRIAFTVTGQNYVNLDETNEIGQNFLYYQQSNAPDFPVLFMAKVNATEANYVRNKDAPSAMSSFVFPNNVMEVKTAWRRVRDITNSDPAKYHQAEATYYTADASGVPQIQTDVFALIAIHVIQKTANYQHFIFTSFEHVDAVTRNTGGAIVDPAYKLTYNTLSYDTDPTNPQTASPNGAYGVNAPGQPAQADGLTTYTLPAAGTVSEDFTTVVQPRTITSEVNDVNNAVGALITSLSSGNIWANYRLKGVQAVPTSDQSTLDYFLANIVVESSQPGIQLFRGNAGPNGGLPVGNTFITNRLAGNVSNNLVEGQPVPAPSYTMGGCQGCHGVAQQAGRDFSFLAQSSGGNGKELDSVPAAALSAEQKAAHNARMAESNNFQD